MPVENLCGVFFEQRYAKTFVLYSVTEFFNIESKCDQEKLSFCFVFTSCQKPSESEILFDYAEGTLNLNGTVHSQQNALFCCDALMCFSVLLL